MKKLLLSLLCLAMCFSMAACSMPGGAGTAVCQHRDVNDDSLCDKCSETYVDGKDIQDDPICQHRDINDDSKCDRCDSSYTDGKDVIAPCQHRDMDDNNKCDTCGVSYSDGQDVFAVCQHRDADDDAKCDNCGEDYTDGKDVPDAPVCQHRDADDNEKCDECGGDYADGKDLECAHDFSDWTIYGDNADAPCDQKPLYRVCSVCGGIEWKDGSYENHSFETVTFAPTCQAEGYDEKTCIVCGLVEKVNTQPVGDHDYNTTYESNNSFHWLDCKNCDVKDAYAEHTVDESGFCTTCNAPLAPTEGIVYDVSADGTYAEVIGYTGTATKILIAETYEGLPVKTIYSEAFQNNDTIKQVVIPDSVTSIGDWAFADRSALTSVTIGNSVTSIGDWAFADCSALTSVTIPDSVTSIGSCAFYGCSSLASVTIENDAVVIGNQAFDNCHSSLYTEYEFGKYVGDAENPYAILIGVTNKNLSTYKMHEDTKIIAYSVFHSCQRLISITIPDSVISISDGAFFGCSNLTSVTIGNSVTSIGYNAFCGCNSLASVYYKGNAAEWNAISIHDSSNVTLTDATRYYYSEEAPTEEGNYWHYDADGKVAVW